MNFVLRYDINSCIAKYRYIVTPLLTPSHPQTLMDKHDSYRAPTKWWGPNKVEQVFHGITLTGKISAKVTFSRCFILS